MEKNRIIAVTDEKDWVYPGRNVSEQSERVTMKRVFQDMLTG